VLRPLPSSSSSSPSSHPEQGRAGPRAAVKLLPVGTDGLASDRKGTAGGGTRRLGAERLWQRGHRRGLLEGEIAIANLLLEISI
jgi:hypothetical protein